MAGNAHSPAQKEFIVRKLAAFEPPRSIVVSFCAVFPDTRCVEQDVLSLDPESNPVSPELYALFLKERERVLLDPRAAPFTDQRARLIALSADATFYGRNNQLSERRAVLRQIAEETGAISKGGKAAPAAVPTAPPDSQGPIVAIKRTIVDPAEPVAATDE